MGGYGRTPFATETHDTSQKSARNPNVTPWLIVIHHAATESFRAVVQMELGTKQVSSTVVIKDGEVASMFDEAYRAWSLSSTYYDSVSLSSETCNSGGAAANWPISEQSYVTLANVCAEWCRKYGIPANRERIIGHREVFTRYGASYATACPGGIDLDRLVRMINEILTGTAGGGITPIEQEEDMPTIVWTEQHGIYTVAPGVVISHPNDYYIQLLNNKAIPGLSSLIKVGAPDLSQILFDLSGMPTNLPAPSPGYVWRADATTAAAASLTPEQITALGTAVAAQIKVPVGVSKADVAAAVSSEFSKVFKGS